MRRLMLAAAVAITSTASLAGDFAELVKQVRPSVVRIEVEGPTSKGIGSGFVVRDDGIVATNFHVVGTAAKGHVIFEDGRTAPILGLVGEKRGHDMVLLKIGTDATLSSLPLCEQLPEQGEDVFTFGNPEGLRFTVTRGIVSAIADTEEIMHSDAGLAREMRRKFSPDATWIQTDAPISSGNSGGPLINSKGEVVGINTWCRTDGQNLNFAGSALTIRKMLKLAANEPGPLPAARASMNTMTVRPGEDVKSWSRDRIALPTGKTLDFDIFSKLATVLSDADRTQLEAQGAFSINYPSGKPFALLQHMNGELHGLCCAQHENGNAMLLGRYEKGERSGNFRMAADDGKPLLDAQFARGKKNGLVCFYKEGQPLLVQECSKGKPQWSHRLEGYEVAESLEHKTNKDSTASEKMQEAIDALAAFEKKLKANEVQVKKLVKELEEDIRKQRAAARGALSQQMIQQRINSRAAENAAVINGLRSASGF
jgi:S1-C subfamily serine protease/antitoxin component YwqK of YwqJK toxin-antitoxin module